MNRGAVRFGNCAKTWRGVPAAAGPLTVVRTLGGDEGEVFLHQPRQIQPQRDQNHGNQDQDTAHRGRAHLDRVRLRDVLRTRDLEINRWTHCLQDRVFPMS